VEKVSKISQILGRLVTPWILCFLAILLNAFMLYFFGGDLHVCGLCIVSESEVWNSYVLTHSKEAIAEPLTTLPTKELEAEALKLFKVRTSQDKLFALDR